MKKIIAILLTCALCFSIFAHAENSKPVIDTTTFVEPVDQVLMNYKEKLEELNKQFDSINTRSTTRYATQI